ncbi:hypothetical protein RZS08_23065, partial [Arthrospira platensis SPKY1]|nr:hypothetical protein [Arthrospira platensis SPKY1]
MVFSDLDANGALDFSPNSPEIVQTNTYYPFGMLIEGMQPIDQADPVQAYRYNGKELTLMGGLYDYGAR